MSLRISGMAFVVVAVAATLDLSAQTVAAPRWGSATGGLRIGIARASPTVPLERAGFVVSLQNVSAGDFVLNLGIMLANGKSMFPQAIRIALTNPDNRSRELEVPMPRVGGRVDDFIVALRRGATYGLPITLDQYWNMEAREYSVKLNPGRYRISARFEGHGAAVNNVGDMRGVALLNFWLGTVDSGVLEFDAR